MMNVILFEDHHRNVQNATLIKELNAIAHDLILHVCTNVDVFDQRVRWTRIDVFILDIVVGQGTFNHKNPNEPVFADSVGLELAARVRSGYYPIQNRFATIIIRSARARDVDVKLRIGELGIDKIFIPGDHDYELADLIGKIYHGNKIV